VALEQATVPTVISVEQNTARRGWRWRNDQGLTRTWRIASPAARWHWRC